MYVQKADASAQRKVAITMENTFELLERKLDNDIYLITVSGELDALMAPKLKELMSKYIDMGQIKMILD